MRIDFQIAILLALAALPAGVALMAAPEYIGILKEYPAPFFWGGLILTAVFIAAAIIIALRGEASEPRLGHKRRMIALAGMIIFGLGFLGSAAVYFWPQRPANQAASDQKPWKHELEDLYNSDFNHLLSTQRELEAKTFNATDDPTPITIQVRFRIYQNFNSGTDFVSLYIPISIIQKPTRQYIA